jgi:hypothetical protein
MIDPNNLEAARESFYRHFRARPEDAIFLVDPTGHLGHAEMDVALARHEFAMGVAPMKIFLSHKSPDKTMVREYKTTLELLGFQPWLDEDAMVAGVELERGILQGMQESAAAVFFLTPRFADENYLRAEINYAIQEYRKKPGRFSIIVLVLEENGARPPIPGLLMPYVWKEPRSHLQALQEILRALPLKVGHVGWRS